MTGTSDGNTPNDLWLKGVMQMFSNIRERKPSKRLTCSYRVETMQPVKYGPHLLNEAHSN